MKKYAVLALAMTFLVVMASVAGATYVSFQCNVPEGRVGQYYRANFSATTGTGIHIDKWEFNGSKPAEFTFSGSGSSATLYGTPHTAGSFQCSVTVETSDGGSATSNPFTLTIRNADGSGGDNPGGGGGSTGGPLKITNGIGGVELSVGAQYPENLYGEVVGYTSVEGGTPPYKWSLVKGDLPKGLCLACSSTVRGFVANSLVGPNVVLSGVAAHEGIYDFTLKVTDSSGQSATTDCSVKVIGGDIDDIKIEGEIYGYIPSYKAYSEETIYVEQGGHYPLTWSKIGGALPEEVTVGGRDYYAVISGWPSSGKYHFVLKVTDADGRSAKKAFSVVYREETPEYGLNDEGPSIPQISGEFKSVTAGESYSGSATVSDGVAPYKWDISYGNLPDGVSLAETTGQTVKITGTPKAEGVYNFVLRVTDANNITNAKTFVIKVAEDPSSSGTGSGTGNGGGTDGTSGSSGGGGGGGCNNSGLAILGLTIFALIPLRKSYR